MTEDRLHLALTAQQMDYVANVLAQRPYAEVAPLLGEIQRQVTEQQRPAMVMPNGHDVTDSIGH